MMAADLSPLVILLIALIVDRLIGDPDWIWQRLPHPVVWFGKGIALADRQFNRQEVSAQQREKLGFISIAVLMIAVIVLALIIAAVFAQLGAIGIILEILLVSVFLAQKSLADHVKAVANGLRQDGIEGGRRTVAMIVGRNPETLDESGVCRAAIESLAENASDGVVAPAFWYAIFGLPGLFAYKMLNTADSMIGHNTDQYRAFGRASAKFDDLANWVPARLTAMFILVSKSLSDIEENAVSIFRNAKLHRSPNAGWPESAMALVLGVALGGPRYYHGDVADEPFMNASGRRDLIAKDIDVAVAVFYRAMLIGIGLLVVIIVLAH